MTSVKSLFAPVEADLEALTENLKNLVGARHPIYTQQQNIYLGLVVSECVQLSFCSLPVRLCPVEKLRLATADSPKSPK